MRGQNTGVPSESLRQSESRCLRDPVDTEEWAGGTRPLRHEEDLDFQTCKSDHIRCKRNHEVGCTSLWPSLAHFKELLYNSSK